MKVTLTRIGALALLVLLFTSAFTAKATQFITLVYSKGGQLMMYDSLKVVVPPNDTAYVHNDWATNFTFIPDFLDTNTTVLVNTDTVPKTFMVFDSTAVGASGTYYIRGIAFHDSTSDTTSTYGICIVTPIWVSPTISVISETPTNNGGIADDNYFDGYSGATIATSWNPFDSTMTSFPYSYGTPVAVSGSGTNSITFTGMPQGSWLSYRRIISNPIGSDTIIGRMHVPLTPQAPWVRNDAYNISLGSDSVSFDYDFINYGLSCTTKTYIALHNGLPSDSIVRVIAPNQNAFTLSSAYGGLMFSTKYDIWAKITDSLGTRISPKTTVTTLPQPTLFDIVTDSARAVGWNTERVYGHIVVPTGQTGRVVYGDLSIDPDSTFLFPEQTLSVGANFPSGVWNFSIDYSGLNESTVYDATFFGDNDSVQVNPGTTFVRFTFHGINTGIEVPAVVQTEGKFLMYPNPAALGAPLHFFFLNDNERTITFCDITGKEVVRAISNASRFDLSIGGIAPGMYLAKIQEENKIVVRKVIIQ